jgi:hypothetical protein
MKADVTKGVLRRKAEIISTGYSVFVDAKMKGSITK